jgi:holo-ACP synthase CitX
MPNLASLQEILANKEARAKHQEVLRLRYGWPILSLSINMPGASKQNSASKTIFETLRDALHVRIEQEGWNFKDESIKDSITGPEMMLAVQCDGISLKHLTCELEETHPLGRFGDIDVISPDGGLISRKSLGYPSRLCYLCNNDAKICARSQAHSVEDLHHFIHLKITEFHHESCS